jgi:hypothetical protein
MLEFNSSEYSTNGLIHPVNIIDQDRRSNETITVNQSNDVPKTGCHPRYASMGSAVICSFEVLKAMIAGSRDLMGVDGKFLAEISLNAF